MAQGILSMSLEDVTKFFKLPEGYKLIAAQCDLATGYIKFLVDSEKIEEAHGEFGGALPTVSLYHATEWSPVEFVKTTPIIEINGKPQ